MTTTMMMRMTINTYFVNEIYDTVGISNYETQCIYSLTTIFVVLVIEKKLTKFNFDRCYYPSLSTLGEYVQSVVRI